MNQYTKQNERKSITIVHLQKKTKLEDICKERPKTRRRYDDHLKKVCVPLKKKSVRRMGQSAIVGGGVLSLTKSPSNDTRRN